MRLSPPTAGVVLGALIGIIDLLVHESWPHFRAAPFEPLGIIFIWVIACCTAGLVFSSQRLGRLRWIVLAFAGPGVLLLSRGATPFKEWTGWSSSRVLMAWVVATLLLAIPLSFVPLVKTRHALAYCAAMLIGIGIAVYVAADVRLQDWTAPEAHAASGTRNVVLVFLDTTRADDSLGSTPPAMPNLARFAKNAMTFSSAWAPASWTVPSHFAVFTGANWWRVPVDQSGAFQYDGPRLATQFHRRGYDTAAVFANPLLSAEAGFSKGFDEFTTSRNSGVCHSGIGDLMYRILLNDGPRMPLCGWFTASEVTARAKRYIRRAHRPYMLAVNYLDTHDPYYVPPECRGPGYQPVRRADRGALLTAGPGTKPPSASVVNQAHAQYRVAMSCMDRSLGELLDAAARDPNTVIAVVGDHGEEFLDHGRGGHGFTVYRESIQVPLVLRVPGEPPQQVTVPVSTTDLYSTLLRASGLTRAEASLTLLDPKKRRPVVSMYEVALGPEYPLVRGYSVVSGDYQFILSPKKREVLYAYGHDPAEARPIPPLSMPAVAEPMRQLAIRVARDKRRAMQFSAVGYMR
ncbi:MAG TPA: sulfatase [Thermoanaerobaculia bacterium]